MYQVRNKLKDLIYIQENKACNEQTVKGLFRAIVEPVLDKNLESLVLCRLEKKSKRDFGSILKRLEYSNAKVYDFSDEPIGGNFENVLKDKIWDKTEFLYVLTERYGAALIFDYEESEIENFANFYIMHNSKNLTESFDAIKSNSNADLTTWEERWKPDRRDNETLNFSIRKIIENLNETGQEMLISQLEKEPEENVEEIKSRLDFISTKSSYIAHEMRNMLSIGKLYSEIIEKQESTIYFTNEDAKKSIVNARNCIRKTMQMMGNLLLDFRSMQNTDLKTYDLKTLTETACELGKIYAKDKAIEFSVEIPETAEILADANKLTTVLINLIKNAVESIDETQSGKIKVTTKVEEENAKITISNNGRPISKEIQEKIFEEGFTTKASGSGLGLVICKKTLEEQFAQLKLKKSDEVSTEFEITLLKS